MKTTTDLQDAMWDILCGMSGEDVARAMMCYHGNRLLSEGFAEFLVDEGYCYAEELGLEDEDEDEGEDDEY